MSIQLLDLINSKLQMSPGEVYKPLPGKILPCLMPGCNKPFLMRQYTGYPDQICPECAETYKDCGRIICNKCNITICRIRPKVMDNGFYIKPRMVLHTDHCNICKPGLTASTIIEIASYEKATRPKKIIVARSYR